MQSTDTDNIDWAASLPFSQPTGISTKFPKELPPATQGTNDELSTGGNIALLARFIRTLIARNIPEIFYPAFTDEAPKLLGEGATYRVSSLRFSLPVLTDYGPAQAAFKTAKIRVPQSPNASFRATSEEYRCLKSVLFEAEILSHPAVQSHPNFPSLKGHTWLHTENSVVPALVMELAVLGNARAFLGNKGKHVTPDVKIALCDHVAAGLEFLHTCNITHGDVKLDNILIFEGDRHGTFVAKISDFERSPQNSATLSYTGTMCYNAPEVQVANNKSTGSRPVDPKQMWLCDVFSFGILALEACWDGTFYRSLSRGLGLMNSILDGLDVVSLALEIAHDELKSCPELLEICSALIKKTLPHRPSDRLREGWISVHRLFGSNISDESKVSVDVLQQSSATSHSLHSVSSLSSGLSGRGVGLIGSLVKSDLMEIATSSSNSLSRGRALFSLFLSDHVDKTLESFSTGKAETLEESLQNLTDSAVAKFPAAFIIGQRVFEANDIKVPEVFLRGPNDEQLRQALKRLAHDLPDTDFYSAAVQTFWPPVLRDACRRLFPVLDVSDNLFDMPTWIADQIRLVGRELFKRHAEQQFFLHRAILNGSYASCERLILLGCDINARMPGGITPLNLACRCAEVEMVKLLLKWDADASLSDNDNSLPLHWLVLLPNEAVADGIATQLADSCKRAGRSADTASKAFFDDLALATNGNPLSWAIHCRNYNLVRTIIHNNIVDPTIGPTGKGHYLTMAAATVCTKTAECLLQFISQKEGSSFGVPGVVDNMFRWIGSSPIFCSSDVQKWAMHGRGLSIAIREFIDTLERFGGVLNLSVAFSFAIFTGPTLMKELVRRGVNINTVTHDGYLEDHQFPLDIAIANASMGDWKYTRLESVRYLLSLGAKITDGSPPIQFACNILGGPAPALLKVICESEPDLETRSQDGFTPLLFLVRRSWSLDAIKVLVEAGANVRAEREMGFGETALAYAVLHSKWEIIEYLLQNGATLEFGVTCGRPQTVLHRLVVGTFGCMADNIPGFLGMSISYARKLIAYDLKRDLANEPDYDGLTPCHAAILLGLPELLDAMVSQSPHGMSLSAAQFGLEICASTTSIENAPKEFQVDGDMLVLYVPDQSGPRKCRWPFVNYKKSLERIREICEKAIASTSVS
ncbi:hypothetical protein QBC38DRAFT_424358 [Podospora fimiseda]|uniref:Protein kinase domain-containing protein n=1 Tax=Podospora fimiseda TaxID=252190 RepID=A0AAN7BID8_9PEZI|nr:hypothetical protein QBC38DRAFT_424358 [Podospora fimiseda]